MQNMEAYEGIQTSYTILIMYKHISDNFWTHSLYTDVIFITEDFHMGVSIHWTGLLDWHIFGFTYVVVG